MTPKIDELSYAVVNFRWQASRSADHPAAGLELTHAEATAPTKASSTRASTDLLCGQMRSVAYRSPGERKGRDRPWRGSRYDAEDSGALRDCRPLQRWCG